MSDDRTLVMSTADAEGATTVSVDHDPTPVGGVRIEHPPRRWRRRILVTLAVLVVAGAVYYAVTLYQVHTVGQSDQARPVDAIVVMGAAQYDGTPSPQLQARLDHVLVLWQAGYADTVVVTGGKQPADRFTEADASAAYLVERGVPADAVLREDQAHNTFDSLAGVAALLPEDASVLIVTDPYHSLRSRLTAEEVGLTAYVSPRPVTDTAWRQQVKEAVGVAVGRIIGFERLLALTG